MSTIYAGAAPIKNLGHKQFRLLSFALKYPGWHSYAKDSAGTILSLEKRKVIEHSLTTRQFRFKQPMV